jgi:AcrR family transcriptional regulator
MSPKVSEAYKEEKRISIMNGALHCIADKGYQATTIDDIVKYLGISKGAIYNYFSSKEEIFVQLMDWRMNQLIDAIKRDYETIPGASIKLKNLMDKLRNQSLEDLRHLLIVFLDFMLHSSRQEELKEFMKQYSEKAVAFIGEIIEEGQQSGEFRADLDSKTVANLFSAVRDGIAQQFISYGSGEEYRNMMLGMEEMIFRYLKN